jgi:hypothetical protein
MTNLTHEILEKLSVPFQPEAVFWKPGATTKDKTRAMALAYVDPRCYLDRLNEVLGGEWSDHYEVQNDGQIVVCHLTILGVTRCDVGEDDSTGDDDRGPKNKATTSAAQAFKRACVKFGLGAYLYRLPRTWAEYDPVKKQFTEDAQAKLMRQLGGPAPKKAPAKKAVPPAGTGDATPPFAFSVTIPAGEYEGKTMAWLAENDRVYLDHVAHNARDEKIRAAALEVWKSVTEE